MVSAQKIIKSALILVAAGKGERAGGDIPKQYQHLGGESLMAHTLRNAVAAMGFDRIIVVVSAGDERIDAVISGLGIAAETVTGGAVRTDSVRAGLEALRGADIDHVYIHDAARPFVTGALMAGLSRALETHMAAAPSLPIADALKSRDGGAVDRAALLRVQTPQAFHYGDIMRAFDGAKAGASFADDIAIAKENGMPIAFTQGDAGNFKVTYPEDFAKAERMIKPDIYPKTYTAIGSGFDVHRFEPGDSLWLCGVEIPAGISLKGHSDADVGLHALTDALLGAICAGDIGDHFPPGEPKWAGASSDQFLVFAAKKTAEQGGTINHVDVTLICEKPKIKPHRQAMRARVAEILGLPLTRVSIKATTTEKLGFTGRGEGIAAQAVASVSLPDV